VRLLIFSILTFFTLGCNDLKSNKNSKSDQNNKTESELLVEYSRSLLCLSYAREEALKSKLRDQAIVAGSMIGKSIIDINNDEKELISQNFVMGRNKNPYESGKNAGCWK